MISFKIKLNSFGQSKECKYLTKSEKLRQAIFKFANQEISTLNLNVTNLSTNQEIYKQTDSIQHLTNKKLEMKVS